jgi:hypothetical protein
MADPVLTIEVGAAVAFLIGMIFLMRGRLAATMKYGCHGMSPAEREPPEENQ